MSDLAFVRIVSWHVVRTPTRVPNGYRTVCGRNAFGPAVDILPTGKGCETCFRFTVTSEDNSVPLPEDDGSTAPVETLP